MPQMFPQRFFKRLGVSQRSDFSFLDVMQQQPNLEARSAQRHLNSLPLGFLDRKSVV